MNSYLNYAFLYLKTCRYEAKQFFLLNCETSTPCTVWYIQYRSLKICKMKAAVKNGSIFHQEEGQEQACCPKRPQDDGGAERKNRWDHKCFVSI